MYYQSVYPSPVGLLTLASDGESLIGLWPQHHKHFGGSIHENTLVCNDLPVFHAAKSWLDRYFAGRQPSVSEIPLSPVGGAFRQAVWRILAEIPYGETMTYGEIARRLAGSKGRMSAQAVGGAVGHNPLSIIIPCHRVVGSGGNLTGYAGGMDMKIWLLRHEGADMAKLFLPDIGKIK